MALSFTGDPQADELLGREPLALLLGMLLDQQFPMERAFHSPYDLAGRLGRRLDAADLAAIAPEELVVVFRGPPALHRYPGSMAARTQELCRHLVEHHGGRAERVWEDPGTGAELFANLRALPGFGDQKARIFVALLAKRLGVAPSGWEDAAGAYASPGYSSIADVDGAEALARVRQHKQAVKAEAKARAAAAALTGDPSAPTDPGSGEPGPRAEG